LAEEDERCFLLAYLEGRFGIPISEFHDCAFFKHRQSWWMVRNRSSTPLPSALKVSMVGMKAFQKVGAFTKPTTRLIQALGPRASRSKHDLGEEGLRDLLRKGEIDLPVSDLEDGYVILCLGDYVLGLGLLIRGKLKSQIPRKDLKFYCTEICATCTEFCAVENGNPLRSPPRGNGAGNL
jgi:NOL1/NOP2/fmu family ribosome biogenesis protein